MVGKREDREVIVTEDQVVIISKSEVGKYASFTKNRWSHFVVLISQIDDKAKELNRKICPMVYHQHVGDGFFVSVNDLVMCVDIRKFFMPYSLLKLNKEKPTKTGILLCLDKWAQILQIVVLAISQMF